MDTKQYFNLTIEKRLINSFTAHQMKRSPQNKTFKPLWKSEYVRSQSVIYAVWEITWLEHSLLWNYELVWEKGAKTESEIKIVCAQVMAKISLSMLQNNSPADED